MAVLTCIKCRKPVFFVLYCSQCTPSNEGARPLSRDKMTGDRNAD